MIEKVTREVFIIDDKVFLTEMEAEDYESDVKEAQLMKFINSKRNEFKLIDPKEVSAFIIIHIDEIAQIMNWDITEK